jgi:hypothetical protein
VSEANEKLMLVLHTLPLTKKMKMKKSAGALTISFFLIIHAGTRE